MVMRIRVAKVKFNLEATKVIYGISTSPAPNSMALTFSNELGKVSGISGLGGWGGQFPVPARFSDPEPEESNE